MRELSMHILDLAQNSIVAGANKIDIEVIADTQVNKLTIKIVDNGCGMSEDFLKKVFDPFTTTRTTRKVGLGIPMFVESARACEGSLEIDSEQGNGTNLEATFRLDHIDRAPLGDILSTLITLIAANPQIRFVYSQIKNDKSFKLDTDEINKELDGIPINEIEILKWLKSYISEQLVEVKID